MRIHLFLFLFSSSLILSGCWTKQARQTFHKNKTLGPYDMIIVPGIPFNGKSWDDVMMIRVHWAKYLYDQGIAKKIMFSGGAVYTPYVEAEIMRKYAVALGIPAEDLFIETRAEHSTENVFYCLIKACKMKMNKVAIASDPYQTALLTTFVTKKKLKNVHFLPMDFNIVRELDKREPKIDPSGAYIANFESLVNRKSFFTRIKGTRGDNCDISLLHKACKECECIVGMTE